MHQRRRWWCTSDDDDQLTGLTTAGGDAGNAHPAVLQPVGVETLVELQRAGALDIFVSTGGWAAPARGAREATVDSRGVGRVLHDGSEASRRGTASQREGAGHGLARCERTMFFFLFCGEGKNITGPIERLWMHVSGG